MTIFFLDCGQAVEIGLGMAAGNDIEAEQVSNSNSIYLFENYVYIYAMLLLFKRIWSNQGKIFFMIIIIVELRR